MFVSFNDGDDWQSLDLNLPPVPITDLSIRSDNLVAATQGRAFWVLDDLFTIRQANVDIASKPLHVYSPGTIRMLGTAPTAKPFEGKNRTSDVPLYYYVNEEVSGPVSIDILNSMGQTIRHYSSEESDHDRCRVGNMDPRRPFEIKYPPVENGLNKWAWNMDSEDLRCIDDIALFAGFSGPRVPPGEYAARVRVGENEETVSFTLVQDPRSQATTADIEIWSAVLNEAGSLMSVILSDLDDLRLARVQIQKLMDDHAADEEIQFNGAAAIEKIGAWEAKITQLKHQTYEDEDAWETMLAGQIRYLLDVIDKSGAPVTDGAVIRLNDLKAEWAMRESEVLGITNDYLTPINAWAREQGVDHVKQP
jgi:hypothetical protein